MLYEYDGSMEKGRTDVVRPGVVNLEITRTVEKAGLFFPPDPSSQVLHHRRKRGGKRRRAAHAGLRGDRQPHSCAGVGAT